MKKINIVKSNNLYKWNKNWKNIQEKYWDNEYKLRRVQDLEDFIFLNNYKNVFHVEEVYLNLDIPVTENIENSDLVLVTHQGYSRYPLDGIIEQCYKWLDYADLYLCLNRHYLNINNCRDYTEFDSNFLIGITEWLSKNLPDCVVVDMSKNYIDDGSYFTWVIPDRQYFIKKIK